MHQLDASPTSTAERSPARATRFDDPDPPGWRPSDLSVVYMCDPIEPSWAREVHPIGVVHSPFLSQTDTPRQPASAGESAVGRIEVFERYAAGLADIEGFDRLWLISWLDRIGGVSLKVVPFGDTLERGLFATRAQTRPNPIGLSPLRLLSRDGNTLHVADLDLLDGTPVLDIKPYIRRIDSFPDAAEGWIGAATG